MSLWVTFDFFGRGARLKQFWHWTLLLMFEGHRILWLSVIHQNLIECSLWVSLAFKRCLVHFNGLLWESKNNNFASAVGADYIIYYTGASGILFLAGAQVRECSFKIKGHLCLQKKNELLLAINPGHTHRDWLRTSHSVSEVNSLCNRFSLQGAALSPADTMQDAQDLDDEVKTPKIN